MCLITAHAHLIKENEKLSARVAELEGNLPEPPSGGGKITSAEIHNLLRSCGIIISGSTSDRETLLLRRQDAQRFLDWYRDTHPYTADKYDCDKYAWCMRAAAIKWTHGEYLWGYIDGEGLGEINYAFPSHGWNFVIFDDLSVWFCDELALAAPEDEFYEAYKIKCYSAKA